MINHSLEKIRHSLAHLMAAAVLKLWPDAKLAIGPTTQNGFYYDFEFSKPVKEENLLEIEKEMRRILKTWDKFEEIEETKESAKNCYQNNPYKIELIEEIISRGESITSFKSGEFIDLCRGGHVDDIADINLDGFKLTHLAGAYWRGSEKNKMLTRIYGVAFATQEELEKYLLNLEEAQKRDHRKLGKDLQLFTFSEHIGPGLPLFLPKGSILRRLVEGVIKDAEDKAGYQSIWIPHITKGELYKLSGHLDNYDAMYPPMIIQDDNKSDKNSTDFYLKPMNCPHFMMLYKSEPHSYRDLPLRWVTSSTVYRHEKSGELSGLMRVCALTQDDCHVFCRVDQIETEINLMLDMIKEVYAIFGFKNFWVSISTRDPSDNKKYIGDLNTWNNSETILKNLIQKRQWKNEIKAGEAAFYGPKLDFILQDAIGREWQLSTIQLDVNLPERFDLNYINQHNKKIRPVVIHRAILGSTERFLGILIEHYSGIFPTWLAPVQVIILTITNKQNGYGKEIFEKLRGNKIRVELDNSDETIGKKIRRATFQKIPFILIIGEKESATKTVAVRKRGGGNLGQVDFEKFKEMIKKEIETKS